MIQEGDLQERYTSTGKHSGYEVELIHRGLNEVKHLSARDMDILDGKIHNQKNSWKKKWALQIERQKKEKIKLEGIEKSEQAEKKTEAAKQELSKIENILLHTLDIDDAVDWDEIKNTSAYSEAPDSHEFIEYKVENGRPEKIKSISFPKEPDKSSFFKSIPLFKTLIGQKQKILSSQNKSYTLAIDAWNKEKNSINKVNDKRNEKLQFELKSWKTREEKYFEKQNTFNRKIDELKDKYSDKNAEAIEEYCEIVLNSSEYPEEFPKDFDLQYNSESRMLLIDYILPNIDNIPNLNIVKYIKTKDEFTEKYISQAAHSKLFDAAVYQIALRTLHEIFEADVIDAVESINFNGIVNAVNPATGHLELNCIISIQVQKQPFLEINLDSIDPKQCFKSLKGVGSTKLSSLVSVRPILELDKSDKRFKDHYEVASGIDDSCNLAAMDWEDFEHLIREIFEKEFAANGGEVKVTQASSDGGVDAIAFDPDPIRGGKIVIQAKRYTNTVGVSAVRDLYGTVLNEGATKGILVTTADFGPDSYNFVKDKPLTLLNGGNLLHLLEKHGHKAKIDIKEAKKILKEQMN